MALQSGMPERAQDLLRLELRRLEARAEAQKSQLDAWPERLKASMAPARVELVEAREKQNEVRTVVGCSGPEQRARLEGGRGGWTGLGGRPVAGEEGKVGREAACPRCAGFARGSVHIMVQGGSRLQYRRREKERKKERGGGGEGNEFWGGKRQTRRPG